MQWRLPGICVWYAAGHALHEEGRLPRPPCVALACNTWLGLIEKAEAAPRQGAAKAGSVRFGSRAASRSPVWRRARARRRCHRRFARDPSRSSRARVGAAARRPHIRRETCGMADELGCVKKSSATSLPARPRSKLHRAADAPCDAASHTIYSSLRFIVGGLGDERTSLDGEALGADRSGPRPKRVAAVRASARRRADGMARMAPSH